MVFPKRILFGVNGQILNLKMALPHDSGSSTRFFKNFYAMAGAKRFMKIVLMVFPKKFLFRAIGSFWAPKKWHGLITLVLLFKILQNEVAKR